MKNLIPADIDRNPCKSTPREYISDLPLDRMKTRSISIGTT